MERVSKSISKKCVCAYVLASIGIFCGNCYALHFACEAKLLDELTHARVKEYGALTQFAFCEQWHLAKVNLLMMTMMEISANTFGNSCTHTATTNFDIVNIHRNWSYLMACVCAALKMFLPLMNDNNIIFPKIYLNHL